MKINIIALLFIAVSCLMLGAFFQASADVIKISDILNNSVHTDNLLTDGTNIYEIYTYNYTTYIGRIGESQCIILNP